MSKALNPNARNLLKKRMVSSAQELTTQLIEGDAVALSEAITLVESKQTNKYKVGAEIIESVHSLNKETVRVGITGLPGVGKSTFINAFTELLVSQGSRVAVLSIDPTSKLSHGSILGDKTRMGDLVQNSSVFVRPSASGEYLGGVNERTYEAIQLCEAAGFDYVIVESVGVGQNETEIVNLVDFNILLLLAGAGDDLQGMKRGIMESAHLYCVNKYDGVEKEKVDRYEVDLIHALDLIPSLRYWKRKVLKTSSVSLEGVKDVLEQLNLFMQENKEQIGKTRSDQSTRRFKILLKERLLENFFSDKLEHNTFKEMLVRIESQEEAPFSAVNKLLKD